MPAAARADDSIAFAIVPSIPCAALDDHAYRVDAPKCSSRTKDSVPRLPCLYVPRFADEPERAGIPLTDVLHRHLPPFSHARGRVDEPNGWPVLMARIILRNAAMNQATPCANQPSFCTRAHAWMNRDTRSPSSSPNRRPHPVGMLRSFGPRRSRPGSRSRALDADAPAYSSSIRFGSCPAPHARMDRPRAATWRCSSSPRDRVDEPTRGLNGLPVTQSRFSRARADVPHDETGISRQPAPTWRSCGWTDGAARLVGAARSPL